MQWIKHFFDWKVFELQGGDYSVLAFFVLLLLVSLLLVCKWRKQDKFQRAEITAKLLDKIDKDEEMQSFMQKIESGEEWYNDEFSSSPQLQRETYSVLSFYNYVCYLQENHVITKDEYMLFEFSIQKLAVNISFQNYMFQLFHKTEAEKQVFPFYYLLDNCAEKMPGGFLDKKSENYKRIKWGKRKK